MLYSVIIAGGVGTRLWPLSRQGRPKQMLSFPGQPGTLLQQAADRLVPLVPNSRTMVVTACQYMAMVAQQCRELPLGLCLGEPDGRNTAAAIGWAAETLCERDPQAVMVVLTADHVIRPKAALQAAVARAVGIINQEPDALVTFGVRPTRPHTGYGYLHLGPMYPAVADATTLGALLDGVQRLSPECDSAALASLLQMVPPAYQLLSFREKPDAATAQAYVDDGRHLWNSGMFCWRAATLRDQLIQHRPDVANGLARAMHALRDGDTQAFESHYRAIPKVSVDVAVMEPSAEAGRVRSVALDLEWHDLGGYESLAAVATTDPTTGDTLAAETTVRVAAERNILVAGAAGDHLIAIVGLQDVVVVHTSDATLVCHRSQTERLREVVAEIDRRGLSQYL